MFVDSNLTTFYAKRAENYHTQCKYNFVQKCFENFSDDILCLLHWSVNYCLPLCLFLHLFAFLYCITILSTLIVYFVFSHHTTTQQLLLYSYPEKRRSTEIGASFSAAGTSFLKSITALVLMTECKRVSCVMRMSRFLVVKPAQEVTSIKQSPVLK